MYRDIVQEFDFSEAEDAESALLLSSMISGRSATSLAAVRSAGAPEEAVLCGGGDSLTADLEQVGSDDHIVAADGATSALLEQGLVPDYIVTDLDGVVKDQVDANARGSVVFVHAHGDNSEAIRRWAGEFTGSIVGTCQGRPVEGVFDFGGFTDGDRAACIMAELGTRRMRLAGFDFDRPSAKPGRSSELKQRKLVWARRIMALLEADGVVFAPVSER